MENPRKRYVQQFKKYPDVVSVLTFREMLGGIGDTLGAFCIFSKRRTVACQNGSFAIF